MRRLNMLALTFVGLGAIVQAGCAGELGAEESDDASHSNEEIATTQQALVTPGGSGHNMMLTKCSNEFENCVLGTSKLVAFGKHPNFVYKSFSQPFSCVRGSFGGADPAPGVTKACYYTPYAFDKSENESGSFEGTIAFGANGRFNFIHNE
ncbi:MAG TPA: hypothetical protein VFZ61_17145, partial [Polyangiales bacterium]